MRFLTKKDLVLETLRDQIVNGVLAPGTRLAQEGVAATLNVSPTPVREAFLALASEGLLKLRTHYGAIVARPNYEELRDTFRLRGIVEVEALRLAVKHVDADLIAQLEHHYNEGSRSLKTLDSSAYRRASTAFHETLLIASQSHVFIDLGRSLIARTTFPLERRFMVERLADHRDLLAALKKQSWSQAGLILQRHSDRTPALIEQIIQRGADKTSSKAISARGGIREAAVAARRGTAGLPRPRTASAVPRSR